MIQDINGKLLKTQTGNNFYKRHISLKNPNKENSKIFFIAKHKFFADSQDIHTRL